MICNRIRCLISQRSGITYVFFSLIKVNYCDFLLIENLLTLRNVITHIKSVLNKDQNHRIIVSYNRII